MKKYNILPERQFGFKEARSTKDTMAYVTIQLYENMDKSRSCICVFVDLAFDTVCHKKLLKCLERVGFRGIAYELIKYYNFPNIVEIFAC